jgi:hypothetical protein
MRERILAVQIVELERRQALERAAVEQGCRETLDGGHADQRPARRRR